MDFHIKAQAALVTNFCVSDTTANQQLLMLHWWKSKRMQRVVAARGEPRQRRRWWVKPWRDVGHESATGEASTMFHDLLSKNSKKHQQSASTWG